MALLSGERIDNDHLGENWEWIGAGGFGDVYKTRHKSLGLDMAIKLVRQDPRSIMPKEKALYEEASHMDKASFDFVLRIYGIYQGCPPVKGLSMQQGIVIEFMERGSIETLQNALFDREAGKAIPPPWPLAFRLAHHVALGMNFLHSIGLLHQDLKPGNVLLNDDLNAKLGDFGLSRVSASILNSDEAAVGGTKKYTPPEAFDLNYKPVRSFDIYSYGILLWSIFAGEEPYPGADYERVVLRIPKGDRPNCEGLCQKDVEGLKALVDLMRKCWDTEPSKRPIFSEIHKVTDSVFTKHKKDIRHAVNEVLQKLDSPTSGQHSRLRVASSRTSTTPDEPISVDVVDNPACPSQTSVSAGTKCLTVEDKAKFVDDKMPDLVQDTEQVMDIIDEVRHMFHKEAYSTIKAEKTPQEKMRALYDGPFRSAGEVLKAAFYDALKKRAPELMRKLDG
ncbi:ankyrin repeat and protein kinase domain-containing protein 1-like isoform 2-T2 [Odontesthes bonariensis]|uniref:ankyrin repeat and protein kinase domain-containing protein 1-like isoform X2 n=1 Tax=Odontesthes bonariensis TaxID=219752 RepID=UPI003F58AC80